MAAPEAAESLTAPGTAQSAIIPEIMRTARRERCLECIAAVLSAAATGPAGLLATL
jgi:hypothetical protein